MDSLFGKIEHESLRQAKFLSDMDALIKSVNPSDMFPPSSSSPNNHNSTGSHSSLPDDQSSSSPSSSSSTGSSTTRVVRRRSTAGNGGGGGRSQPGGGARGLVRGTGSMSSTRDLSRNRSMRGFGASFSGMIGGGGEEEEVELVDCNDAQTDPHEHALCSAGVSFGLGFKAPSRLPGEWDKEVPVDERPNNKESEDSADGNGISDIDKDTGEEGTAEAGIEAASPSPSPKKSSAKKKGKGIPQKGAVREGAVQEDEESTADASAAPPASGAPGGGVGSMAAVQEVEDASSREKMEAWRPAGRKGQAPPPRVVESGAVPGAHMPLKLREQMSSFPQTLRIPSLVQAHALM